MDVFRMIGAELLKLRRRSLIAWTAVLTVGVSVALVGYDAVRHHNDPAHYGPAGGVTNLNHAMQLLAYLGTVAAVLIGTTAGGADQATGVFRDLVTTGRGRTTLFLVRVPAALAFYLAAFAPAFAVSAVAAVTLAGSSPVPSGGMLVGYGLGVGLSTILDVILAVGLSAAVGSRSIAIGILLGWDLAMTRLLEHAQGFGAARQLLPSAAVDRILPAMDQPRLVPMTLWAAALVLAGWAVALTAAGAWRTATRDA